MTSDEAIRLTREHIERQFPKTCNNCGQAFASLDQYLGLTSHVGNPVSLDAELGDWRPQQPAGTLSFANCRCGSTLAIGSQGMNLVTMWRLMRWGRSESKRRGITFEQLLAWLRVEIDRQVLATARGDGPDTTTSRSE